MGREGKRNGGETGSLSPYEIANDSANLHLYSVRVDRAGPFLMYCQLKQYLSSTTKEIAVLINILKNIIINISFSLGAIGNEILERVRKYPYFLLSILPSRESHPRYVADLC